MSDEQLRLPLPPQGNSDRDQLERDIDHIRHFIKKAEIPPTFEEIQKRFQISKDRTYLAISALHKSGEIGWSSRATDPGDGRATFKLKEPHCNDSEVARPKELQVARPLKCKFFKKGRSQHKYLHLCSGNKRICYIGGRLGSTKASLYKAAVESAIAQNHFSECQTKADFKAVVRKIKQDVDF